MVFLHFRMGTFIEAWCSRMALPSLRPLLRLRVGIFIAILSLNREVSRGLRSPVLETTLVSRTGLFSLKHEDVLDTVPAADSSCQLSESEMTKSDARNL